MYFLSVVSFLYPGVRQLQNQASPKESSFWGFPLWVAQGVESTVLQPETVTEVPSACGLAVRPAAGRGLSLGK